MKDERQADNRTGDEMTGVFVDNEGFETQICTHVHHSFVFYVGHRMADRRTPNPENRGLLLKAALKG